MDVYGVVLGLVLILLRRIALAKADEPFLVIEKEEQARLLVAATRACQLKMANDPVPANVLMCNRTWDDLLCWPDAIIGSLAKQACPGYVNGFNPDEFATRRCLENGSWWHSPATGASWTNFSQCGIYFEREVELEGQVFEVPPLIQAHLPNLRRMYNVGYAMSLASLSSALFIMIFLKKLHCQRNTVHLNLFISFMLRSLVNILKENVLVQNVGFPKDVTVNEFDKIVFKTEGSYTIAANYMWIFVEGIYLHMLIFVAYFTERSNIKWYIVAGWSFPLTFVIPWVLVRVYLENRHCWNTHRNLGYYWITRAPIVVSIVVNFAFFVNIVRVLFSKLKASGNPDNRRYRYKRLAKSTLVLIPLFGVHYILFVAMPENNTLDPNIVLTRLCIEMFFNSFQGFFVALLFCFMNGEVQAEIKKIWNKKKIGRGSTYKSRSWYSVSGYWSKYRNSAILTSQPTGGNYDNKKMSLGRRKAKIRFEEGSSGGYSRKFESTSNFSGIQIEEENIPLDVIKEEMSHSQSKESNSKSNEESVQSDHNDNYDSFSAYDIQEVQQAAEDSGNKCQQDGQEHCEVVIEEQKPRSSS